MELGDRGISGQVLFFDQAPKFVPL